MEAWYARINDESVRRISVAARLPGGGSAIPTGTSTEWQIRRNERIQGGVRSTAPTARRLVATFYRTCCGQPFRRSCKKRYVVYRIPCYWDNRRKLHFPITRRGTPTHQPGNGIEPKNKFRSICTFQKLPERSPCKSRSLPVLQRIKCSFVSLLPEK